MEIKYRIDLYKLLPSSPVTAELGVAEGFFSKDILEVWRPKIHYMVDMWESHPEFPGDAGEPQEWHTANYNAAMKRVEPYTDIVEVLCGPTVAMAQAVANESLDLVYVDACHSYDCVIADINAWWPKIKPGGVIAFHDYQNRDYGVNRAVKEWFNLLPINDILENKWEDAGAWVRKP